MEHESLPTTRCTARGVITMCGSWRTLDPRTETVVIMDDSSGNYLEVVLHNATDEEIDRLLLQEGVAYQDSILTPEQEIGAKMLCRASDVRHE